MRKLGDRTVHRLGLEALEPRLAPATFWVTTTADSGPGSLRQAILDANSNAGPATIAFAIGKGGVQTIMPTSALPTITQPVEIDGRSQPGYKGQPLIELAGTNAGSQANGLTITGGNSTVRGLVVNRFGGFGIFVERKGNNRIIGNYLGTDVTGTVDRGNHLAGLAMWNQSDGNIVGGTSVDSRNLISANSFAGISISSARENLIEGNYIGTDATGIQPLGNGRIPNGAGVDIFAGSDNVVGGAAPGAGNLISANWGGSIALAGVHQIVQGNYLGTDWTGTQSTRAFSGGIFINGRNHLVGGTASGARNVIVGTVEFGANEGGISVQGNYIGTDVTGTHLLGIGGRVTVRGQNILIGGTTPTARNIIAGSNDFRADPAVNVLGDHNRIQGNYIGTDVTGTVALGNQTQGIALGDPSFGGGNDNLIGGVEPGAGNLISGNRYEGVGVVGSRNTIQGNRVGTDASGTKALGNGGGIYLGGRVCDDNLIGGTEPAASNLVSGNRSPDGFHYAGIAVGVDASNCRFNRVQGNYVGTNVTGTLALPNDQGVAIGGTGNVVGGAEPGAGNLISGNLHEGLGLSGSGDRGLGNWIGVDSSGTQALPNGSDGVLFRGTGNVLGGTEPGAGNVISANAGSGVRIESGSGLLAIGNRIGTDASGQVPLGNTLDGVQLVATAPNNRIGGTSEQAGNTIAFNGRDGVRVEGSTGNAIAGNSIFGNTAWGIELVEGGNHDQEAPDNLAAFSVNGLSKIAGMLKSTPKTRFTLEWFANSTCDESGYAQGERLVGRTNVATDADGFTRFALWLALDLSGQWLTATATDPDGNTSQFSRCAEVQSPGNAAKRARISFETTAALLADAVPASPLLLTPAQEPSVTESAAIASASHVTELWPRRAAEAVFAQAGFIKLGRSLDFDLWMVDLVFRSDCQRSFLG